MPTQTNSKPTLFISYCRGDKEHARKLMADLDAAGHSCWIDTASIPTGEEWARSIAEGISASYALIPVITSDSLESRWVHREILWAQQQGKPIFPWVLQNVLQHAGFFPLVDCQGVKLFELGYDAALRKLLASLPAPSLRVTLDAEQAYLERLQWEELVNTDKYTPMGGASQQQRSRAEMRAVFELLPMGRGGLRGEPRRFENAVAEIRELRRAVLLGEPGGGKTTTIWKLAADLVAGALADPKAPIPLLVRLGKWTDAAQSLPEFIAAELGDLGPSLDRLLAEKRAALLLDGLNELPTSQRASKYPQVRRLIEQHSELLAVVSCRELDYTDDLGFHRVTITPLDPIRIREFVKKYLGEDACEALF